MLFLGIGYFHYSSYNDNEFLILDLLKDTKIFYETEFVKCYGFKKLLDIRIDGMANWLISN